VCCEAGPLGFLGVGVGGVRAVDEAEVAFFLVSIVRQMMLHEKIARTKSKVVSSVESSDCRKYPFSTVYL
jgi:hypothetical protein